VVRLVTKRGRELAARIVSWMWIGSVLDERVVAPVIEKDKRDKKDDPERTQGQEAGCDAAFKLDQNLIERGRGRATTSVTTARD